jgi:hypothetical protein
MASCLGVASKKYDIMEDGTDIKEISSDSNQLPGSDKINCPGVRLWENVRVQRY